MKRYFPPIAWMGVMFVFSSDLGSMNHTRSLFDPLIRFFVPGISAEGLHLFQLILRKSAHLFEYAVLSVLWCIALNTETQRRFSPVFLALCIAIFYAGLDELHQGFVKSRTGSVTDVGIDALGAVIGVLLLKGGRVLSMSSEIKIRAKYFGWWFAWGGFSAVMLLIVSKGASLAVWQMLGLPLGLGTLAGIAGVVFYVRRG
ncbi:MAG: VanZ family protein [Nitrospirota bacterium]|nr:VanZ family protein [Nitrospirota bacterium]